MLKKGILNPQVNELLARVRHTNALVIADRGFPSWLARPANQEIEGRREKVEGYDRERLGNKDTSFVSPDFATIDLSLVDDVPTVLQVYEAIRGNFSVARIHMAREFLKHNDKRTAARFKKAFGKVPVQFEPHVKFKKRVPTAIGLIRTGDTVQYANMILVSG